MYGHLVPLDGPIHLPVRANSSRKGPRNFLFGEQSVMAKMMSENDPAKSFSKSYLYYNYSILKKNIFYKIA